MIILGIDPGTATTGYGVIEYQKKAQKQMHCLNYGIIQTSLKDDTGTRLKSLSFDLNEILKRHKPELVAIESLFFFKNLKTAIPVSQARGVIIYTIAKRNVPIVEYTPLQAKIAVTGYGHATKNQVQKMVMNILELDKLPKPDDAADALAIAICCAEKTKFNY